MTDDMLRVRYVDRASSDDELRAATAPILRDRLNDAITAEILKQLGPDIGMSGDAIRIPGHGATDVDRFIDVEAIIDAIQTVIDGDGA
jgi:hypothetical protein